MFKSTRKQLVAAGFLSVVVTLGCDDRMPTAPTVVLPPAPAPTPSVAPPVVIGVTPNKAPTAVPTLVAIFGQRFHPESTVTFGGVAGSVVQMTETGLTVMAPAHEAGIVEIAVTNPDGLDRPARGPLHLRGGAHGRTFDRGGFTDSWRHYRGNMGRDFRHRVPLWFLRESRRRGRQKLSRS